MVKLADLQRILLAHAAQQDSCSLYPLPDRLKDDSRIEAAVAAMTKRSLVEERQTSNPVAVTRREGDMRFGLFASARGLAAIGVTAESEDSGGAPASPSSSQRRPSKAQAVTELLQRDGGATMSELIDATRWLPHTTRAVLTGLRKKGHIIERSKRDEQTCYRIIAAAAA